MKKYNRIIAIMGSCLLAAVFSACSSPVVTETQAEVTEASKEPENLSEASETPATVIGEEAEIQLKGFDTPENAVAAYLTGLKTNDLAYMMDTFGGEIYVDHYILQKASELAQTDILSPESEVSAAAEFSRSMFIENRNNEINDEILRQYAVLFHMSTDLYKSTGLGEDGKAKELLDQISSQINSVDFGALKLLGFIPPEKLSDVYSSEAHQKNMPKIAKSYGADKFESRMAVIEVGGSKYLLFLDVIEYDGRWFNLQLGGVFAKMMDIDAELAGTMLLDAEDEQVIEEYGLLTENAHKASKSWMEAAGAAKPAEQKSTIENAGFHSPQEAAKAYLEGFQANDLNRIISTFAIESYVDHFDLQARIEYINNYLFMKQEINLPLVDDFSRDINIQSRKKAVVQEIAKQYSSTSFINGEFYGNVPIEEKDGWNEEDRILKLAEMANAMDFDSMKILGYIPYADLSEAKDLGKFQKHIERQAAHCGADKMEGSIVFFELGGNKYYLCLDTIEYNGKWYIKSLGGNIASILNTPVDLAGTLPLQGTEGAELERLMISYE